MFIQSFENKSNLAEWFEHRNHYSVVVTRHKDNKRTEYKLQKNDYVYDMLKVKGSVTALVNCAKDLIVNFSYISPTVTTDNKSELQGVVESEGEALFVKSVTPQYLNLMIPPRDCEIIRFALDIAVELNAGCDPEHIHIKDFERLALFFKHLDYSQLDFPF